MRLSPSSALLRERPLSLLRVLTSEVLFLPSLPSLQLPALPFYKLQVKELVTNEALAIQALFVTKERREESFFLDLDDQ